LMLSKKVILTRADLNHHTALAQRARQEGLCEEGTYYYSKSIEYHFKDDRVEELYEKLTTALEEYEDKNMENLILE